MEKIIVPLWLLTIAFTIAFLDGLMGIGLSNDVYFFLGLGQLVAIVWAWRIYAKYTNK